MLFNQSCIGYTRNDLVKKFVDSCIGGRFEEARYLCKSADIKLPDFDLDAVMTGVTKGGYTDILGWLVGYFNLSKKVIGGCSSYLDNLMIGDHLSAAKKFVQYFKPTPSDANDGLRLDLDRSTLFLRELLADGKSECLVWMIDKFDLQYNFLERMCSAGDLVMAKWLLDIYLPESASGDSEVKIAQENLNSLVDCCIFAGSLDIIKLLHDRFGLTSRQFANGNVNTSWRYRVSARDAIIQWAIGEFKLSKSYIKRWICEAINIGTECDEQCPCEDIASEFTYVD